MIQIVCVYRVDCVLARSLSLFSFDAKQKANKQHNSRSSSSSQNIVNGCVCVCRRIYGGWIVCTCVFLCVVYLKFTAGSQPQSFNDDEWFD